MSTSVAAPAQHKQPSRKGKKAWRKNVDVTEVHEGLQEVRDQIIQGGVIAEKTSDELFVVDTSGDKEVARKIASRHKPLKADQILAQRSAVPAVSSRKRLSDFEEPKPKKSRVSGKDYDKLRALAYGGEQVQKDIVEVAPADHDPWAEPVVKKDPKFSFLEEKKAKREPVTLKHAPVSLAKNGKEIPAIPKPDAGKSYNPLLEDWANLIEREGQKEVEAEKVRLEEARQEAERMELIVAAAEEPDTEDDNESAWESEWEGFSDVDDESKKQKRPERKTPAQRNKIKRRKEAERLARHEAKMRARDKQAAKIQELIKSVEEKEKATAAAREVALTLKKDDAASFEGEVELRKKRFGKNPIPEPTLEVVLADELQDCLRRLKPEGNLLKDRFRSMIVRGKLESRRQIAYHKKKKTTLTEKWSYKDWTLDSL